MGYFQDNSEDPLHKEKTNARLAKEYPKQRSDNRD